MINYVDLDTIEVCTKTFLLRKHSMAKAADAPLTVEDLETMNAAVLDETATGDVATGNAVLDGTVHKREYRDFTPEEVERNLKREILKAKNLRDAQVSELVITIASGLSFDADETSQNRMTRAITASVPGDTTSWKMADNTVATITHEDLKEALALAGAAQTALWF